MLRDLCKESIENATLLNFLNWRNNEICMSKNIWRNNEICMSKNIWRNNEICMSKNIYCFKDAEKIMEMPIDAVVKQAGLVGTKWFLDEMPTSIIYHSLACNTAEIFNCFFSKEDIPLDVSLLSVKEKTLGYNRAYTFKIVASKFIDGNVCNFDGEENQKALCYVIVNAEPCQVPKKQSNSKGIGMQITGVNFDFSPLECEQNITVGVLLEAIGNKEVTMANWLTKATAYELAKAQQALNVAIDNGNLEEILKITKQINKCAENLATQVEEINRNRYPAFSRSRKTNSIER